MDRVEKPEELERLEGLQYSVYQPRVQVSLHHDHAATDQWPARPRGVPHSTTPPCGCLLTSTESVGSSREWIPEATTTRRVCASHRSEKLRWG
ncbi:hypothetical protein CGGC5_v007150 [Colletotrichum fructicola Nara gc5]|uniref:Uncharacterized protein n=1 Tax=Colletotrichum fructicola (strain Nara gc5) TaxID=1213859 RepID=A0A7J6J2P2_COLFN|nr:hypothetical protein CGGC5_v007150 [Colletotrichum fructicola Nara gc5]